MPRSHVKDLMTPSPVIIPLTTTLIAAAQKMDDMECGILPVGTKEHIEGIITDRDIVIRAVAHGVDAATETVQDYMSPGVCCCQEEDTAEEAADLMRQHHVNRLVVTKADGTVCGILTLGRIMREDRDMKEVASVISHATGRKAA